MPQIIDTTLREGEQAPGVYFTLAAKKRILTGLAGLGVEEVEVGVASHEHQDLAPVCRFMHNALPDQPFSLWCRCREADIRYAASLAPSCLALSIPSSDLHLRKKLSKNRDWAANQLKLSIGLALELGIPRVAVGLEDATRAEFKFIKQLATIARNQGASRLRLADTVGIATPDQIKKLITGLLGINIELGVHCHNDFGMATANTITALEHGARWGDATLLGLGERAGNCRLEEVVCFLALLREGKPYKLDRLRELSDFTADQIGFAIPPSRPIIGSDLFCCETGLHLQGLMKDPSTYEPFDPAAIGRQRTLMVGRLAGKSCIKLTLKRLGLPWPDDQSLRHLTHRIRSLATKLRRHLSDEEIHKLASDYFPTS